MDAILFLLHFSAVYVSFMLVKDCLRCLDNHRDWSINSIHSSKGLRDGESRKGGNKMNCPNCGNPLPDGAAFCGNCGTQLGQQMQPQMQQMQQPQMQFQQQGMYGQPQGMPQGQFMQQGYMAPRPKMVRVPKYVKPSVCRIVGAVLILIASIVPIWFGQGQGGAYYGAGFFTTGGGVLPLWGILLMLTALALLFFEIDLPQIRNVQGAFHALPGARFYLPGFALFLLLMGTFAHGLGTHDIGWGWWLCLIGILLCCVSPVVDLIQGNR